MNWKSRLLHPVIVPLMVLTVLVTACDSFENDVLPDAVDELAVKNAVSVLPGTSLFIDLKKSINASNAVKVRINTQPSKGSANIEADAILHYTPNPDFISGQDFFSLNLLNEEGSVIDTDSIFISVVQSTDSLPCFNGALSDYYFISQNNSVTIRPIENDGYCGDAAAGAVIKFVNEPEHGALEQLALFTYKYTPEPDFTGKEIFMYELELIDNDGNSSFSLAQISIEVHKQGGSDCDSVVYPIHYKLEKPLEDYYIFEPFHSKPGCDSSSLVWTIDSLYVQHGKAEVTADGLIKYVPSQTTEDFITYKIAFSGRYYFNSIQIEIKDGDSQSCPEAVDDEFYLHIVEDSIGTSANPYVLPPANNDVYCTSDFVIRILEDPVIGVAMVQNDQKIQYYADEEFTGVVETTMFYEICDVGRCDSAYVDFILERPN